MLPSVKGLQALSALALEGSLTAAAGRLGATRSALSHRIADLERQLGVTLVRTVGRRATLTEDAERLLSTMGDALERIEAAVEPLRRRRQQIRLSTVSTFASDWLIPRLPAFQVMHPHLDLAISTTTRVVDLDGEDIDCAIRHGVGRWPGLDALLLFRETLVPVAATGIEPMGLAGARIILARSRPRDWPLWWRGAGMAGSPPDKGMMVETRAQALAAALAGAGVVMTDAEYVRPHVDGGRLRSLGPIVTLQEGYYLVNRSSARARQAVAPLRQWLEGCRPPHQTVSQS